MDYEVYETDTFKELFETLDEDEKEWVRKIIEQLKNNPKVGKPLRFDWFREKKYKDKRMYYLIYTNLNGVLIVAFGNKKEQKKIISHIIDNLNVYKSIMEKT